MSMSTASSSISFGDIQTPIVPTTTSLVTIIICAIAAPFSILTVAFRFYAQRYSKHGICPDDYALVGAVIFLCGMDGLGIWAACTAGVGWPPMWVTFDPIKPRFERVIFSGQILWGATLLLIRSGLLLFYRRIFAGQRVQRVILSFIVINCAWFLTYLIGVFAKYRWRSSAHEDANYATWLLVHGVLDLVQDLAVLCIPLFVIGSLHMERKNKLLVSGLFVLGFFCVISSCVRLKYFVDVLRYRMDIIKFMSVTYKICVWTVIQPTVALFTACLPAYVAAFQKGRFLGNLMRRLTSRLPIQQHHESKEFFAQLGNGTQISKIVSWSVQHNASDEDFRAPFARAHLQPAAPFA